MFLLITTLYNKTAVLTYII